LLRVYIEFFSTQRRASSRAFAVRKKILVYDLVIARKFHPRDFLGCFFWLTRLEACARARFVPGLYSVA
jgi:hypothetical protein